MASIEDIKKLRKQTSISLMECKKALEQVDGDMEKAKEVLRKKGMEFARKRIGRSMAQGIIKSYIHSNEKIGVLLDIRCETDFVARSENFHALAKEVCMQIAAMSPDFVRREDIPKEYLDKERAIYQEQFIKSDKPKEVIVKIVDGKINKLQDEICLVEQSFIKDQDKKIKNLLDEYRAQLGENISIKRFIRYQID